MASNLKSKNKFNNIKSSINSGLHCGNVKIIPKRRGELFRRLKTKEMVTLLQIHIDEAQNNETESICNLITNNNDNAIFISHDNDNDNNNNVNNNNYDYIAPFLLLDIRDEEEFNKYHIKHSKRYDTSLLRRDKLGNDIYAFKNKSDKIIIICCNHPNQGINFSNELSKKYIDNIFLLTISIENFCIKFADLCVGHSFPQKNKDDSTKATMRYVDWRPSKKQKKVKYSLNSSAYSMSSVISNTTNKTWKP